MLGWCCDVRMLLCYWYVVLMLRCCSDVGMLFSDFQNWSGLDVPIWCWDVVGMLLWFWDVVLLRCCSDVEMLFWCWDVVLGLPELIRPGCAPLILGCFSLPSPLACHFPGKDLLVLNWTPVCNHSVADFDTSQSKAEWICESRASAVVDEVLRARGVFISTVWKYQILSLCSGRKSIV